MSHEGPPDERLDPVRFMAASPTRMAVLDAVAERPRSKRDLRESLSAPRTTLRRNLRALEERHWLTHDAAADEYALTPAGRRARTGFRQAVESLDVARAAGAFLSAFPGALPGDPADLDALTVVESTDSDPHGPVSWVRRQLGETDALAGYLPTVDPIHATSLVDLATAGLGLELVLAADALESLRAAAPSALSGLREADGASVSVTDDGPAYGVGVLDERAFLFVYDDRMRPHALAAAPRDQQPLGSWMVERYGSVAREATPVEE